VVEAGISVRGRIHLAEDELPLEDYPGRIRAWPMSWPARARRKPAGG